MKTLLNNKSLTLLLIAAACLLPAGCASGPGGQKQFLHLTKQQWQSVASQAGEAAINASIKQGLMTYEQGQKLDPATLGSAALLSAVNAGVVAYEGKQPVPDVQPPQ